MKAPWNRLTRIVLVTALVFGPSWLALPQTGSALLVEDKEEWLLTDEALARTAAGDCAAQTICREYCLNSVPTGFFQCFDS